MRYFLNTLLLLCIAGTLLIAGCSQSTVEQGKIGTPETSTLTTGPTSSIPATSVIPVVSVQATPTNTDIPRGIMDPDFIVDLIVPEKMAPGNTLLPDNHNPDKPRIIEVNRFGEIVWEYALPADLKSFTNPGWDVELLPSGNILTLLPRKGVYEINRNKQVVWSYIDPRVSHDADRLPNGNTLVAFGSMDTLSDAQAKEVSSDGKVVWSWYAGDSFNVAPYASISNEGWTHANAVSRLENGNTLISLRNFNFIAEVNPQGNLVRKIGEGVVTSQHDPAVLPNGNILLANQALPHEAMELDPGSRNILWRFPIRERSSLPLRDANRLANGNTLITAADRIIEVTKDKEVVWQFRLQAGGFTDKMLASSRGFYKAERIGA